MLFCLGMCDKLSSIPAEAIHTIPKDLFNSRNEAQDSKVGIVSIHGVDTIVPVLQVKPDKVQSDEDSITKENQTLFPAIEDSCAKNLELNTVEKDTADN